MTATIAARVDWFERIAQAIADAVPGRNDIVAATVVADTGLVNATPTATIAARGATVAALWACPKAITAGGGCFATRMGPDGAAGWVVIATNYQAT